MCKRRFHRECVNANIKISHGLDEEDLTIFSKMWRQVSSSASWCARTLLDCAMRWMQLHILCDVDDNGTPFIRFHTRFDVFGLYQTPWKLRFYAPLDGRSIALPLANLKGYTHSNTELKDPVVVHLNLHFPETSTQVEEVGKTFCIQELWLSPILLPEFPSIFRVLPYVKQQKKSGNTPPLKKKQTSPQLQQYFALRMVEYVSLRPRFNKPSLSAHLFLSLSSLSLSLSLLSLSLLSLSLSLPPDICTYPSSLLSFPPTAFLCLSSLVLCVSLPLVLCSPSFLTSLLSLHLCLPHSPCLPPHLHPALYHTLLSNFRLSLCLPSTTKIHISHRDSAPVGMSFGRQGTCMGWALTSTNFAASLTGTQFSFTAGTPRIINI